MHAQVWVHDCKVLHVFKAAGSWEGFSFSSLISNRLGIFSLYGIGLNVLSIPMKEYI